MRRALAGGAGGVAGRAAEVEGQGAAPAVYRPALASRRRAHGPAHATRRLRQGGALIGRGPAHAARCVKVEVVVKEEELN